MLVLEKLTESGALHLGEENRQLNFAVRPGKSRHHNFVAQILAGGAQFFQDGPHTSGVAAPPGAQLGAFRHLLVEHTLRLAQIPGQVRDAGEENRGRGQAAQQAARIPQFRHADLRQSGAQVIQLLRELLAIAAPADIVLHRNRLQVGAGHGLIAGVQDFLVTGVAVHRDVDFALDHRDARTLHTAGDAEHRARDGHPAIGRGHIQVAGTALGGLHDDAAPSQAYGEVASRLRAGEFGALAQFHHAAILQLQHRVGILGGADLHPVGQVLAGRQHLDSRGQNLIKRAVDGLHNRAASVVAVLIHREPDGKSGGGDHGGGHGPAGGIVDAARGGRRRHGDQPSFVYPAAGHALVQVVFHQQGARLGQMAGLELRDQRLEIGAGVQRGISIQHPGALRGQVGPHPGGRGFHHRLIDGVIADFDHSLLQGRVQGFEFGIHATPPM